ncbi:MAG: TIGR04283 family arsenosugar biosynthesis glycosyltransferase [Planctomycetota bacterium]
MRPGEAESAATLSVLVPTLNEAERIEACVASAYGLARAWSGPIEVIVADGGSGDDTRDRASTAGALVLESPPGRGGQLRAAAAASVGDVLLMLHADCVIDPAAGGQLREAIRDRGVQVGAFRQRIEAAGIAYRLIEHGNAFRARRLRLPYGDQAIFLRRETLAAIGGLPNLPLMEDVALMQRVRRIARPALLAGPVKVSARRWRSNGVVRQTLRNWALLAAFAAGVPAERIASCYGLSGNP